MVVTRQGEAQADRQTPRSVHTMSVRLSACGRVEDGRGSLGPKANTPFPISAHRAGHAELPHPALRLASPQTHDEAQCVQVAERRVLR